MEHWDCEISVKTGSVVSLFWSYGLNSERCKITLQLSTLLEILCETLVKTWNDYVREHNLPFRSIDVTDLKGMTQNASSSDSGESPRHNFGESHPVHSTRSHSCVKCRNNCTEQVHEHVLFDYFRKHLENSCTERSPDSGGGQNVPAATSSICQQENSALPDHFTGEDNKFIARIEEPNDSGKNEGVWIKCDFTISKDSKLDPDKKVIFLGVNAEKQQDERETCRGQQEMQSTDLNFPKDNVEIAKESGNTDMKCQHGSRAKENEIYLEFQNTITIPQGRNKLHNKNTLKFPELQLKNSDRLGTIENNMIHDNPNGDFTSGSKTTANSSEFHLKHSLKSVCYKDDLLHNLIELEKEKISSEVNKITNECMKSIFSKVLINKFNSSLESWNNEFLTTGNEAQVHKKPDILPQSSTADIFHGMDSRLELLKEARSSSIETVFNDFVRNRAEGHTQKSDHFPVANVPGNESGNPGSSVLGQSADCIGKDDRGTKKITTGDEAETLMTGELIVFTSVDDEQETGGMENNCFENESNHCIKKESKTDCQDSGVENKSLINSEVDFNQLKEFDPLTERFTIESSSDTRGEYTAELKMMENCSLKPCNGVMSVVPEKEELSGYMIAEVLRQILTCQAGEITSTVKPADEFDSKKCFKPENLKDECCQKQLSVGNETSDGKQLVKIPFSSTISDREPVDRFDPKEECVKFENREVENCEKQELVGNKEPSSYKVKKCENSVTSSTTTNNIFKGIDKTRREVKRNNFVSKFQLFGKMNDEKCSVGVSTLPTNATIENKLERSQVQNSNTIVDKSTRKWLNSLMFGSCSECEDEQSARGDSVCRIARKDSDRQTHYKDRRCRSKSKKRTETKRKPLSLTKKADKNLMTKRVAFLEKNSVFSYDPNESILEAFRHHVKPGKTLERASRSRERSTDKTQSSLKKMICKPPKKGTTAVRKRSISPNRNVFKNLREKREMARKEMRGRANVKERCNQKNVVPVCESDFQDVFLDGTEGYVNPAFEDVPAYDCIMDLERTDSASISATFEEDKKLLSGEETLDDDKFDAIGLKERGRHAECSMKRWIRDSLLSSKRLSFKKMKAALRKK